MIDRWNRDEAEALEDPVQGCAYGSRLLGQDENLVLHGGGNTSVEAPWQDITGREIPALWVKASGWDLATMPPEGLTPLDLERLGELADLEELSDPQMMAELAAAQFDPGRAAASVESLVHAVIPHRVVLHTHADVIVGLTNSPQGEKRVQDTFGDRVVVVPYTMSGFELSKAVRDHWTTDAHEGTIGLVLLKHGLFTFGATAEEAYRRHVELINTAEAVFGEIEAPGGPAVADVDPVRLSRLRSEVAEAAGRPMILTRTTTPAVSTFLARSDWQTLATAGPLTPDHVIRIKPRAMVGTDVAGFASWYRSYFEDNQHVARTPVEMLDPAPRLILDEELGMVTVGETIKDADIARDIATHLLRQAPQTEDLGGYEGLGPEHLFEIEYWDLEQAKLKRGPAPEDFTGEVALVTGAASGIGRGCVAALRNRGAAVIGLDLEESVTDAGADYLGLICDVTDPAAVRAAIGSGIERFGGIDMSVFSAGMFGGSARIAEMDMTTWSKVLSVNTDAIVSGLSILHPHLALAPDGGRVVVIGSKNVPAPGPGAGAYSASKAAVTQAARVAAMEWAGDGIRVNVVHPDGVFDTALWTDELLAERADKYGMTVDEYKRRNLLSTEITSATVGEVVAELCGPRFRATTGAQIPIDGGNERVI